MFELFVCLSFIVDKAYPLYIDKSDWFGGGGVHLKVQRLAISQICLTLLPESCREAKLHGRVLLADRTECESKCPQPDAT